MYSGVSPRENTTTELTVYSYIEEFYTFLSVRRVRKSNNEFKKSKYRSAWLKQRIKVEIYVPKTCWNVQAEDRTFPSKWKVSHPKQHLIHKQHPAQTKV